MVTPWGHESLQDLYWFFSTQPHSTSQQSLGDLPLGLTLRCWWLHTGTEALRKGLHLISKITHQALENLAASARMPSALARSIQASLLSHWLYPSLRCLDSMDILPRRKYLRRGQVKHLLQPGSHPPRCSHKQTTSPTTCQVPKPSCSCPVNSPWFLLCLGHGQTTGITVRPHVWGQQLSTAEDTDAG